MMRRHLSLGLTLGTLIIFATIASLRYTGFFSAPVFVSLLDDNAFLGVAAIGVTFVILLGGIDLTVGAAIAFTSVAIGTLVERHHMAPPLAIAMLLSFGTFFGAVMGVLIARFDLAPFLVTLAGMFLLRGLAFVVSLESIQLTHPFFASLGGFRFTVGALRISVAAIIFLLVLVLAFGLSVFSRFGRNVYAVGGDENSAGLMGLPVERTKILVYAFSGFCAALGGVVYTLYTASGNANAATALELDAIAAVVIGGTSLSGGRGSVVGTFFGVLILGIIQTAITFENTLSSWWTRIAVGVLLFSFILFQRLSETLRKPRR